MGTFKQRLLKAIGREKVEIKRPSATEPRAGYISYAARSVLRAPQPQSESRPDAEDERGERPPS